MQNSINAVISQQTTTPRFDFTATNAVFAKLLNIAKTNLVNQISLRISVDGGGCAGFSYKYELIDNCGDSDDFVITRNDIVDTKIVQLYVVIDPISQQFVNRAVLDFITTLNGSQFEITNPNAKSRCGCGNSFNSNS